MEVCAPYFIWGILFVLAVVAEIVSFQLVSIWFAAGALAAFLAACFGGSVMLQIILFLAVSVVLLLFTRPIAKKIFSFGIRDTNTQEIGRTASVIQTIDSRRLDGGFRNKRSHSGTQLCSSRCGRRKQADCFSFASK